MSFERHILASKIQEIATFFAILIPCLWVAWFFFIRPHTIDWQPKEDVVGEVNSLVSIRTKYNREQVSAFIDLENGTQVYLGIPLDDDIRAGRKVVLSVSQNADNLKDIKYKFNRLVKAD